MHIIYTLYIYIKMLYLVIGKNIIFLSIFGTVMTTDLYLVTEIKFYLIAKN